VVEVEVVVVVDVEVEVVVVEVEEIGSKVEGIFKDAVEDESIADEEIDANGEVKEVVSATEIVSEVSAAVEASGGRSSGEGFIEVAIISGSVIELDASGSWGSPFVTISK